MKKLDKCDFCMEDSVVFDDISGLHCCEEHYQEVVEERN